MVFHWKLMTGLVVIISMHRLELSRAVGPSPGWGPVRAGGPGPGWGPVRVWARSGLGPIWAHRALMGP